LNLKKPRRTSEKITTHQGFSTPKKRQTPAAKQRILILPNIVNSGRKKILDRTVSFQDVDQRIHFLTKKIFREQRKKKKIETPPTDKHVRFAEVINNRIERINIDISMLQKRLAKAIEKKKGIDLSFPLTRKNLLILRCESQVYGTTFPKAFVPARDLIKSFLKR